MSDHREQLVAVLGEHIVHELDTGTDYLRGLLAVQVRILIDCLGSPRWPELTAVQVLPAGLSDDYDSEGKRAVRRLLNTASGSYDGGCSHGHESLLAYTYHVAMYCAEVEQNTARAVKVRELARLEQQRAALVRELSEEEATDE